MAVNLSPRSAEGHYYSGHVSYVKGCVCARAIFYAQNAAHAPELRVTKTSWVRQVPFFHDVPPRDRFQDIFWMLHVGNVPRKLDKIRPLLDILLPRFRALYCPSPSLTLDEIMVGFRGCFGSIQYVPLKPTKWGFKLFILADAANWYVLNVLPCPP